MLGETANIKEYHPFLSSNFYLWKNMDISSHHTLETPKEEKIPRKRFLVSRWQSDCCSNTSPTWKKNEERKHEIHSQGTKRLSGLSPPWPQLILEGSHRNGQQDDQSLSVQGLSKVVNGLRLWAPVWLHRERGIYAAETPKGQVFGGLWCSHVLLPKKF